jgi:hypothetical protein
MVMREIKFRAWDDILKLMLYGDDIEKGERVKNDNR